MVSLLVKKKLYINEVVLGTAFGVIFGPLCANIFDPRGWGGDVNVLTLEVMRVALAMGLFTIGVELPKAFLAQYARSLLIMVVPTMAIGWVVVAAMILLLFPQLDYVSALVIAACLTPTDPIISAAILGALMFALAGDNEEPLELIIKAESAANDGLAYPFLSLSIFLTLEPTVGVAFEKWVLIGCLYQVAFGTLIGVAIGLGFSRLMKLSHTRGFINHESYVAQYLALTLFTIGVARTLGSDDLLAAFAAGSALNWDGNFNTQIKETKGKVFSSVIDLVLNCGTFLYIGAWMPFDAFDAPELGITPWRLALLLVAVLALRRIPALLVLYKWVPEIKGWKDAVFAGHFGTCRVVLNPDISRQMGVGAVFVSTFALIELPKPHTPPQGQAEIVAAVIQPIVAFVVLGSIVIHGLSLPLFSFGERTLTLTRTWTSRTRARKGAAQPEWLLSVRR
ncbi:Cation/H+ exchanger, partial [Daedaleopsis nitida]